MTVKNPWLIQRCVVKDYSPKQGQKFSDCIKLDYMGSSEFEWGIVPKTLTALCEKRNMLEVVKFEGKVELYILCMKEQEAEYQKVLTQLLARKIQTKEYVFSTDSYVTLWLDLDNQVIFSTNKDILKKMHILLEGSQKVIEHNKKVEELVDSVAKELCLHDIHKHLPGTVALCGTDVNENEGTKALKDKTKYPVVFWLNGPYVNEKWVCGYYTVEDIVCFNNNKTGAIAEYVSKCQQ